MKNIVFLLAPAVLILAVLINGCSSLEFPGTYRIAIHQGNIISQDMVDKLKVGMSRKQVQYVLGTSLIKDSFNQDRWDYYYSVRNNRGKTVHKHISVFFIDNSLHKVTGDYTLPAES